MEAFPATPIDDSKPPTNLLQDAIQGPPLPEPEKDSTPLYFEEPRYYITPQYPQQQQPVYTPPPPPSVVEVPRKTGDIFTDLERTHWIVFACVVLLAFFLGKSMTPVIIKNI